MPSTGPFKTSLLELLFNGVPITDLAVDAPGSPTPLPQLWLSLHTDTPGDTGSQLVNECTYAGYARVAVPRNTLGWVIDEDAVENVGDIFFPQAGGPDTAAYLGIGHSPSGAGALYFRLGLVEALVIDTAEIPRIRPGNVRLRIDNCDPTAIAPGP